MSVRRNIERLDAYLPPPVIAAIEEMARREGVKRCQVVRNALEDLTGYDRDGDICAYPRRERVG